MKTSVIWKISLGFIVLMTLALIGIQWTKLSSNVYHPRVTPKRKIQYNIGICSSVKDDARWLVEWLEFHKLVGIEQMYIIDDGSTDATSDILQKYSQSGLVTIIPGTVPQGDSRCTFPGARDSAYVAKCFDYAAPHLKWMVIMDSDEYLFPRDGCDIGSYIQSTCSDHLSHILLSWEMFGTSGRRLHPHGLLTENLLTSGGDCSTYQDQWGPSCRAFGGNCKECRHTKYIANTGSCLLRAEHCRNHVPARLQLAPEACDTTPDSVPACTEWWEANKESHKTGDFKLKYHTSCCSAGLSLHHYATKSEEALRWRAKRRMRNGLSEDRDATPGMDKRNLNWVFSPAVLRFLPTLRTRVQTSILNLQQQLPNFKKHSFLLPISPDVSFTEDKKCFLERGWRYEERKAAGNVTLSVKQFIESEIACCNVCITSNCDAFTYEPSHLRCNLFSSMVPVWPVGSIPLHRTLVDGFISGVSLKGEVC